jgi:hypothetical protein
MPMRHWIWPCIILQLAPGYSINAPSFDPISILKESTGAYDYFYTSGLKQVTNTPQLLVSAIVQVGASGAFYTDSCTGCEGTLWPHAFSAFTKN